MGNKVPTWGNATATAAIKRSLFEYSAKPLDGGAPVPLEKYKGAKALIVTNCASKCGLTPGHYSGFMKLKKDLKLQFPNETFEVLGFPCAQFSDQEFHDPAAIRDFVKKYEVDFPLFSLCDVNGKNTLDIFQFLKYNSDSLVVSRSEQPPVLKAIGWNFGKFLVDENGYVVKYYGPKTDVASMTDDVVLVMKGELKGIARDPPAGLKTGTSDVTMAEACTRA